MRNSQDATVHPLERRNAVILVLVDGTYVRHVAAMRQRGLSENTIRGRTDVVRLLLNHAAVPAIDVTPDHMRAWQASLGLLNANSRAAYVSHIRQFYRWMLAEGLIAEDPSVVLLTPRRPRSLPRPVPEAGLERALALAPTMIRLWLELAGYEGLRCAEIAGLDRADVVDDAATPYLYIRGKGGRHRTVPMSPTVLRSLLDWPDLPARGALFRRPSGHRVTPKDVSRKTNDYLRRHGVRATIHQFRHRFATQLYTSSGHDLRLVQEQLGHADISTTAGYAAVDPSAAAPAVAAIDHPLLRPVQDTGS
jgi:site-specific recombinase XerD